MVSLCPLQQLPLEAVKSFVLANEIFGIQLAERLEQYISFLKEGKAAGGTIDAKTAGDKGFVGDFFAAFSNKSSPSSLSAYSVIISSTSLIFAINYLSVSVSVACGLT